MEGTSINATVKVYENGSTEETAARKNDYYFRDWDPDTTSTASDYPEINVKEGTTVSATKNAWIPAASESPITYDANGNLTGDALWSYTYDEENRLITMEETSAAATAGFPDTTITFKYDHLGRRVEKKVVRGTTTESHLRFVWRGWLLVAELNAASDNARVKTYTWGPDVSGSLGGAGGNGGVLIMKDHTSTVNESFYPAYDARGNVTGLIDTSGNLDAAYEYDPFGKLIRYAGPRRASMSLLYGTKYTDMESGLIYYGHRYYDPRQGRFINRDPIEEEGGINLYGFVGNSPVNGLDFLGLCERGGDIFPMGTDGVENCEDYYDLQPFVIDGNPTEEDLMIWALQDDQTERLIEQLNSQDLNRQNNVDTENNSPVKRVENKKKKKPEKEKEPCYAYVSIDPVTGKEEFFTLTDLDLHTRQAGELHGLKVVAPPEFDIQNMVESHEKAVYPTIWDMYQWATDPGNDPKTINPNFQNAGNLAYGAVGSALDIELDELNQAAGATQQGESPKIWGDRPGRRKIPSPVPGRQGFDLFSGGTSPYYGNDPVDHYITQDGYNAVEQKKRIEKREVPCEEVGG